MPVHFKSGNNMLVWSTLYTSRMPTSIHIHLITWQQMQARHFKCHSLETEAEFADVPGAPNASKAHLWIRWVFQEPLNQFLWHCWGKTVSEKFLCLGLAIALLCFREEEDLLCILCSMPLVSTHYIDGWTNPSLGLHGIQSCCTFSIYGWKFYNGLEPSDVF